MKKEEKYFYYHELTKSWGCTQQLVDFITELYLKNENIIEELKEELKENKA